jgi:hypothetical protein
LQKNLQRAASSPHCREDYAATWNSLLTIIAWARISRPPYAASSLAALNVANSERVVRNEPPLTLIAPVS